MTCLCRCTNLFLGVSFLNNALLFYGKGLMIFCFQRQARELCYDPSAYENRCSAFAEEKGCTQWSLIKAALKWFVSKIVLLRQDFEEGRTWWCWRLLISPFSWQDIEVGPYDNFRQYGLDEPLGIIRCDNARPIWRSSNVRFMSSIFPPEQEGFRVVLMALLNQVSGMTAQNVYFVFCQEVRCPTFLVLPVAF